MAGPLYELAINQSTSNQPLTTTMDTEGNVMTQTRLVDQAWWDYRKNLLAFIRGRVSSQDDAEDILQEVFSSFVNVCHEDKHPENLGAWCYQVTRNRIIDYYRTKKQFAPLPEDLIAEPEESDAFESLSKCLLPMIYALPDTYQKPLLLSEIQGQKYKAVASELNLSVAAVKSRILRGRKMLFGSLLNCCQVDIDSRGGVIDFDAKAGGACYHCGC